MSLFETFIAAVFAWWSLYFGNVPITTDIATPVAALVTSVTDGDTIIVDIEGVRETVRYIGIDTPEPRREGAPECGSKEATIFNKDLVEGKTVRLVADTEDRDKYERLLRYVYVQVDDQEVFVNQELLNAGLARPLTISPNTSYAEEFKQAADVAKKAGSGIWGDCIDL